MKSQFRHCAIRSLIENWELKIENSRKGFTVLFAVLIGSLLFSLGIAISQLSIKEITLSSTGKQSETAFYAADTGIECALYWDLRPGGSVFPKSNEVGEPNPNTVSCNGQSNQVSFWVEPTILAATTTFLLTFVPTGCANVIVGKTAAGSTVIESRRQNECGAGVNPGRVERALRVRY